MRKSILCFIALIMITTAFAQMDLGFSLAFPRELSDPCNSAAIASGQTWFNADFIDTLNDEPLPVNGADVVASTDGGNTWLSPIAMSNIGGTNYENTWECSRTNAASGNVEYYFICETESTLTTQCPNNSPTSFPLAANRRAYLGYGDFDNLTLDHHGRTDTWSTYDIKDFYGGYDADEFFFHVKLTGGWDDNHQVHSVWPPEWWDVWHLMAIPILNNEAESRDSVFFAVVVGDINLLVITIYDGLYKFWKEADTSAGGDDDPMNNYERLGPVTFSAGPDGATEFSIRFPISLLTSDEWGSWPNASQAIGTGCATVSVWLVSEDSVAYQVTDVTEASGMYCFTENYTIGTNSAPTVADGISSSFNRDTIWVDLSCDYNDADNNLPTDAQLEIDNGSVTTVYPGTPDHIYDDGSTFEHSVQYRCEWVDTIQYRWTFNDGSGDVSTGWVKHALPDEINLVFAGSTWDLSGDSLTPLETVTMTALDYITISNAGTVPVDFGLAVSDPPPGWILADHVAWDTTTVYGHFDDETIPPTFGSDDLLSTSITWADGALLGGGEGVSYCVDGANSENLWFKFTVPRYYSGYGDQTMTVQLWARTDLP